ncbi:tyrosine-type recombinase/integrase [Rhodococcus hoagii]|nr:tyrosine-type recombinase/integrase [Prescottella equi]NKS72199.1 tyrosine-type recombinase/integrase [Prescottella equi]
MCTIAIRADRRGAEVRRDARARHRRDGSVRGPDYAATEDGTKEVWVAVADDELLSSWIDAYFAMRKTAKSSPATIDAYRRDLAGVSTLVAAQEGCPVTDLTLKHIDDRQMMRSAFGDFADGSDIGRERSSASVLRALSTWATFFDFLVAEGAVEGNPMAAIPRPKRERRVPKAFDEDAVGRVLDAVLVPAPNARQPWPVRDFAVIATLLLCGIRSSEARILTLGDLRGESGERRFVVRGKGGDERSIPIEPPLEAILVDYLNDRAQRFPGSLRRRSTADPIWKRYPADAALFVRYDGAPLTRGALQWLVESVYRRAGVNAERASGALTHALRHTFATRLVDQGATIVEVAELMGHRSVQTTQVYLSASAAATRAAAASNPTYAMVAARTAAAAADAVPARPGAAAS